MRAIRAGLIVAGIVLAANGVLLGVGLSRGADMRAASYWALAGVIMWAATAVGVYAHARRAAR